MTLLECIIDTGSVRDVIAEAASEKYLDISTILSNPELDKFFVVPSLIKYFKGFMESWENSNAEYYKKNYPNLVNKPLKYAVGKSYVKIVRDGAVDCFIDKFGNVYKPASWNAPAKGVRYYLADYRNIPFDPHTSFLYNRSIAPRTAEFYDLSGE